MNISGVIVRARPEKLERVKTSLAELPGVEVHVAQPDGRIVITLEDSNVAAAAESYVRLHDVGGVVSVSLVYQYSDESLNVEEARQ